MNCLLVIEHWLQMEIKCDKKYRNDNRVILNKVQLHITQRLNRVVKCFKILWTCSLVVMCGRIWLGCTLYVVFLSADVPLLKHCTATFKIRIICSHWFKQRKNQKSYTLPQLAAAS